MVSVQAIIKNHKQNSTNCIPANMHEHKQDNNTKNSLAHKCTEKSKRLVKTVFNYEKILYFYKLIIVHYFIFFALIVSAVCDKIVTLSDITLSKYIY